MVTEQVGAALANMDLEVQGLSGGPVLASDRRKTELAFDRQSDDRLSRRIGQRSLARQGHSQIQPRRRPAMSDVVHARAGITCFSLDHIGDRSLREHVASGLGGIAEYTLRVAPERAIEQLDHLEHGYLRSVASEAIAALHAALRANNTGAAQHREQLLEELHGHFATASKLADRHRVGTTSAPELGERGDSVGRLAGNRDHCVRAMLRRKLPGRALGQYKGLGQYRPGQDGPWTRQGRGQDQAWGKSALEPAALGGHQHGLGAIDRAELAVDVMQVRADSAGGERELVGDLLVDLAF